MLRIIEKEKIPHVPRLIEAGQDPRYLEAIHKISLYHRDIHPANLMLVGHDILINDWGCAVQGDEDVEYAGTFIHASDRVLKELALGNCVFRPTAADDLESLVRTTFVLNYKRATIRRLTAKDLARELLEIWNSEHVLPHAWKELQNFARKTDYEGLRAALVALIP